MKKKKITEDPVIGWWYREVREAPEGIKKEARETIKGHEPWHATQYWVRGPARIDEDNCEIVLDEDRVERYFLHQNKGLLFDLVELGDWYNSQKTLAFINRYGLLRYGAEDLSNGEYRESLEDWSRAIGSLRFVMALYQSLREAERIGSTKPLHKFDVMLYGPMIWYTGGESNSIEAARKVVAGMITEGLRDCKVGVDPNIIDYNSFAPGKFNFWISPSTLLSAAWAELAYLVSSKAEIETCPGCGRFFSPESLKQKYCTKSCASMSRWRRWKEKQTDK